MLTRKIINKNVFKKKSRRMKYGGMKGMIYQTSYDPVDDEDVIIKTDSDIIRAPKKLTNQKYLLFGGGIFVALIVGVTLPFVIKHK